MSLLNEFFFWGGILLVLIAIIYNIYGEYKEDVKSSKQMTLRADQCSQDWRDE